MQRKTSILVAVLVTALVVAFLPFSVPVGAWYIPGPTPTDDRQYERFGPRVDKVAITVFGAQELEFLAFLAQDIDLMDWPLLPSQKEWMDANDPNMATYARPFCWKFDMFEIDFNNAREPTSDVYFRRALSHLMNKDYFIATELAGQGHKMETPLGYLEGTAWYNTEVITYPPSIADAAAILDADNNGNGKPDYIDRNGDGWRDLEDGTPINLVFYARADDPQRTALGVYFTNQLEVALRAATGAGINVELNIAPKSTCFAKVMGELDYHLYTGHWVMGRDPYSLYSIYHSDFYWGPWSRNYVVNLDLNFDAACEAMLYAGEIGDKDTPSTAVYHAWEMQEIFMDNAVTIPVWNTAGYSGYLTGWEEVVNGIGAGPNSWWTFLNAHSTGVERGGTLRYGFMNDIEALNVVHSQGIWDWSILDKIYDSLIAYNPYDVAEDFGWLAERWERGSWSMAGEICTKLTLHLRKDLYWTDLTALPGGAPRKYLGTQTFIDMPVTPEDVKFTIEYIRDTLGAWNNWRVADVDHVSITGGCIKDEYTVEVYYGTYIPLWALHWIGGLPIMPKHIWEVVPNYDADGSGVIDTREYDPIADCTLVGCGPYTFDYDAMIAHEYYELDANTRYFNYHNVRVGIKTSAAAGTPQIYLMNFKNQPTTVTTVELREGGVLKETWSSVSVPAAGIGFYLIERKPGMTTLTSTYLAAKPPGKYGPITVTLVGGHSYTEPVVALNTIWGDVDGDFGVSWLWDAIMFCSYYGFNPLPFGKVFLNGDIDGDKAYNVLDAYWMLVNWGTSIGTIDPSAQTSITAPTTIDDAAEPGMPINIPITVLDVTNLYGFEFKLGFDPVILTANDVTVGNFLPDYFIWKEEIGADYVWFAATRALGAPMGISGSGLLATVHFTLNVKGVSMLDLYDTALGDSGGQPIPHRVIDGAYLSTTEPISVRLLTGFVEDRHWEESKDLDKLVELSGMIKNEGDVGTMAKVVFYIYDELGGSAGPLESETVYLAPNEICTLSANFDPYTPMRYSVDIQVFYIDNTGKMVGGLKGGHRDTMTVSFFALP